MHRFFLLFTFVLLSACSNLIFAPIKSYPVTPDMANIVYDDLYFESYDSVKLHGWKLHAKSPYEGTILFFHGNGDNVSTQLPNTFWLAKEGYDVYIFDYREFGQSEGQADLDATMKDMALMTSFVLEHLPMNEKLIILGHSLGGSMAIYSVANSAYRERIKTLITVEAFSDYRDVVKEILSKNWLLWLFQWPLSLTIDNSYRPLDFIASVAPIPVAIIHSQSDEIIAMEHGDRLYAAAEQPKVFLSIDSSHSNIFVKEKNRQVLLNYLRSLP